MNTTELNSPTGHMRFVARVIAACISGLVLLIAIGHGIDVTAFTGRELLLLAALFTSVAGNLMMVLPAADRSRRPLIGAAVSLAGIAAFYIIHYVGSQTLPGGWVFPLMFLPGLLFPAAWFADRIPARKQ